MTRLLKTGTAWTCGHLQGSFVFSSRSVLWLSWYITRKEIRKQVQPGLQNTDHCLNSRKWKWQADYSKNISRHQSLDRSRQTTQFHHRFSKIHLFESPWAKVKGKPIMVGIRRVTASISVWKMSTYVWAPLRLVACWPHLPLWLITVTGQQSNPLNTYTCKHTQTHWCSDHCLAHN